MNVIRSECTKQCTVTFMYKHVGHLNDLGNLPLDKVTRDNIASKISEYMPFRHSSWNSWQYFQQRVRKTHLLTKKDLYNIEASYNLNNESVLHKCNK